MSFRCKRCGQLSETDSLQQNCHWLYPHDWEPLAESASGYPPNWPSCECGRPVLDGHLTCGDARCGTQAEAEARRATRLHEKHAQMPEAMSSVPLTPVLVGPRQVGVPRDISLSGMLVPHESRGAVVLQILGGPLAVPLFSDVDKLREAMTTFGLECERVVQVVDQEEFLASVPEGVAVIVDLRKTPEGKVRYFQAMGFLSEEPS